MSNSVKDMRVARGISQSLCIVLLLLACGTLSAQNQEHRVRNIVLVQGAWADGSGWIHPPAQQPSESLRLCSYDVALSS